MEIAGELWLAVHPDGRSALEFSKPPMALVVAQRTPGRWTISFPAGDKTVAGRRRPPSRLLWLYLGSAQAGTPLPAGLTFELRDDGLWRLENEQSGESLMGYFFE